MIPSRKIFLLVVLCCGTVAARADEVKLDFSAWEHMPVLEDGRLMPMDTYARSVVRAVCGRESPTLALEQSLPGENVKSGKYAAARKLFPDGQPRKFTAAELLFSWLVEPDKWRQVPFLVASNGELREEILDVPLRSDEGRKLKFVSPAQFDGSSGIKDRWATLVEKARTAEANEETYQPVGVDKKVHELINAREEFFRLTFNPTRQGEMSRRFLKRLDQAAMAWQKLGQALEPDGNLETTTETGRAAMGVQQSLLAVARAQESPIDQLDAALAEFRRAADELARAVAELPSKSLQVLATELTRQAAEAHVALYDNGGTPHLVPALNPGALEQGRDPSDDAHAWLSLTALFYGSDDLLAQYPQKQLAEVRKAFDRVAAAYVDRDDPGRAERFNEAMPEFAAAVRELGEAVTPIRERLPIQHRDEDLLAATAYPPPGFVDLEVHYNQLDPFLWSWVVSLVALVCFALSFGVLRKPMFWLGIVILLVGQGFTVYGVLIRSWITGFAAITNMFETVVFVAFVGAMLGLWFALMPLVWPGLKLAWRLTAFPFTWEATPLSKDETAMLNPPGWTAAGFVLLIPRLALMVALVALLATSWILDYEIFPWLPQKDVGATSLTFNDWLVWSVGLGVLLPTVWYGPRVILTAIASVVMVPFTFVRRGIAKPLAQVMDRKTFAMVGAFVAWFAGLLAYYAPMSILNKDIGMPTSILRDNFWLLIHVTTITASYGAGALAWAMGMMALFFYLFGRYGEPSTAQLERGIVRQQPPEVCSELCGFVYKATQVAVLLLAAGTLLGALWADKAWGRFWSWDAKEVWALISLLVYLVILHGRYAGWSGNFGLAAISVVGMLSILMAWYGVNFILGSGLHTYGQSSGGRLPVTIFVLCNLVFVAAARLRYRLETRAIAGADESAPAGDDSPSAEQSAPADEVAAK